MSSSWACPELSGINPHQSRLQLNKVYVSLCWASHIQAPHTFTHADELLCLLFTDWYLMAAFFSSFFPFCPPIFLFPFSYGMALIVRDDFFGKAKAFFLFFSSFNHAFFLSKFLPFTQHPPICLALPWFVLFFGCFFLFCVMVVSPLQEAGCSWSIVVIWGFSSFPWYSWLSTLMLHTICLAMGCAQWWMALSFVPHHKE